MIQRLRRFYWSLDWFDSLSLQLARTCSITTREVAFFGLPSTLFLNAHRRKFSLWVFIDLIFQLKEYIFWLFTANLKFLLNQGGLATHHKELLSLLSSFIILLYSKFLFKSGQTRRLVLSLILVNEFGRHDQKCL